MSCGNENSKKSGQPCDDCCGNVYRTAGLRHTRQRHAVMEVLRSESVPLSANDIYERLHSGDRRLNLSTVYRTLDTLETCKVLRKIVIGNENTAFYEPAGTGHHHYLICLGCKKIRSIDGCPLAAYEKDLSEETDFVIEGHSLNIYGRCPDCAQKNQGGEKIRI